MATNINTKAKAVAKVAKRKETANNQRKTNKTQQTDRKSKSANTKRRIKNAAYYTAEINSLIQQSEDVLKNIRTEKIEDIYCIIKIGNIAKEAKENLSSDEYSEMISKVNRSIRQIDRYILLVTDKRVAKLTTDDMKKMLKPSVNKLFNMRNLSDKDFKDVLNGKDDKYKELRSSQKEESIQYVFKNEKLKNIKLEDFKTFMSFGILYVIKILDEEMEKSKQISKESNELGPINNSTAKHYTIGVTAKKRGRPKKDAA